MRNPNGRLNVIEAAIRKTQPPRFLFAATWGGPVYLLGELGNVQTCATEADAIAKGLPTIDPDATDATVIVWNYVEGMEQV